MRILTREDVRHAVPMALAMDAVADAFAQHAQGRAFAPLRTHVPIANHQGTAMFMPAYLAGSDALGMKALTIYASNPIDRGLPAISAVVMVFDPMTGQPAALMDGGYLTALRTGAASGVATRLLARDDARVLALFGAGEQALPQAWAVCEARAIERVWLVNRTREHAERLTVALRAFGAPIPTDVRVASTPAEAVREADVICCATAASSPLFDHADVRAGTHINGIGSYLPTMAEVPPETVRHARVVVDSRASAWAEAGDLVQPLNAGVISKEHVQAELGEVIVGQIAGRTSPEDITFFKSVGMAVQDVAVARVALERARALGLGSDVALR